MTINTPDNASAETALALDLLSAVVRDGHLPDDWAIRIIACANDTDDPSLAVVALAGLAITQWGRFVVAGLGEAGARDYIDTMAFNRVVGSQDWSSRE